MALWLEMTLPFLFAVFIGVRSLYGSASSAYRLCSDSNSDSC